MPLRLIGVIMSGEILRIKSKTLEYERNLSFIFNDNTNNKNDDDEKKKRMMMMMKIIIVIVTESL